VLTLPVLSNRWGCGLDALRALVRTTPELRALGTVVGASRGYSEAEAAVIHAAYLTRQGRKGAKGVKRG
jgi:hypothetical protein